MWDFQPVSSSIIEKLLKKMYSIKPENMSFLILLMRIYMITFFFENWKVSWLPHCYNFTCWQDNFIAFIYRWLWISQWGVCFISVSVFLLVLGHTEHLALLSFHMAISGSSKFLISLGWFVIKSFGWTARGFWKPSTSQGMCLWATHGEIYSLIKD